MANVTPLVGNLSGIVRDSVLGSGSLSRSSPVILDLEVSLSSEIGYQYRTCKAIGGGFSVTDTASGDPADYCPVQVIHNCADSDNGAWSVRLALGPDPNARGVTVEAQGVFAVFG